MTPRLHRIREILRDDGLVALLARVKHNLYHLPLLDESWYLLNRYLRPGRCCVRTVQGSKMLLDLTDPGINRDLFLHGLREPECTRIYRDMLAPGMAVADIGANVGYYVLIEANVLGDTGRIYAIEPAPHNFARLQQNIELNGINAVVETHNMAISDRAGSASFELTRASNRCRLSTPDSSEDSTIDVETMTLDALLDGKPVDVVRMDTEGAEWVIVNGMRRLLARGRPLKMFIEVHPRLIGEYQGSLDELLRALADNEFNVTHVVRWQPESHFVIPYIKARAPREYVVEYGRPLAELLRDKQASQVLLCRSGHAYHAGYKLFVER